jgi:DmsE family decaheme c-type cytochrome
MVEAGGIHRTVRGMPAGEGYCESCHGPGSAHAEAMDAATIFNKADLEKLSALDRSGACLSCHQPMAAGWTRSPHAGDAVSCWDCHGDAIHGSPTDFGVDHAPAKTFLAAADGGDFCGQCHEAQKMQFVLPHHHPVAEGKMGCADCHAVHGEDGRIETALEPSSVCTACHAQVAGPWVFEHEAMNEGCQRCHEPHGSANRKLLAMSTGTLCLQCHVQTTFPTINGMNHELFVGAGADCWDCHVEVHGSNSSPSLSPGR